MVSLSLCLPTDSWQIGRLPTHWAAKEGHVVVLEILYERAPATLEAKNSVSGVCVWGCESLTALRVRQYGYTPLHLALKNGHAPVVRLLVERVPPQLLETRDRVRGLSLSLPAD